MGKILKFSGNNIDRLEVQRRDENWISDKLSDPESKVIVYNKSKVLVKKIFSNITLKFIPLGDIKSKGIEPKLILVGDLSGEIYLATDLNDFADEKVNTILSDGDEFIDCRTAGDELSLSQGGIISQSKSQLEWNRKNGFCGICGGKTNGQRGGQSRKCLTCETEMFPRTDPVIITLVSDGDYCLLGQSKGRLSKLNIYSCLAGFVDQGESIEEAVSREIMEESGIKVKNVNYYASQPWPFPWSLMIGCHAEAETNEINYDEHEMHSVKWFHRDEVLDALKESNDNLSVPGSIAIAHHLIKAWATKEV
jgi:NAD+ diphosphatase